MNLELKRYIDLDMMRHIYIANCRINTPEQITKMFVNKILKEHPDWCYEAIIAHAETLCQEFMERYSIAINIEIKEREYK